jgi:hypothetical protein
MMVHAALGIPAYSQPRPFLLGLAGALVSCTNLGSKVSLYPISALRLLPRMPTPAYVKILVLITQRLREGGAVRYLPLIECPRPSAP